MYEKSTVNNIPVITAKKASTSRFMLFVGVRAGNEHETDENAGIAHLTEHMLFTSTQFYSSQDLIRNFEWHGIDTNAGTGNSHVYVQCSGPVEKLEAALEICAKLISEAEYTQEEFEREKNIVLEELRSYRSMPSEYIASWETEPRIMFGSPAARNLFGTEESLKQITLQDIYAWKKAHYTAENIFITVCSGLSHDSVCEKTKKYFSNETTCTSSPFDLKKPSPQFGTYTINREGIDQGYVQQSFLAPSFSDEKYPVALLLNYILDGGMSSRVFQELREKRGLGYHTGYRYVKESGYATFFVDGTSPNKVEECTKAIQEIIIALETIPEDEFKGIKTLLDSHIRERFEDDERLAYNALMCHVYESPFDYETLQQNIATISIQDVIDLAKELFSQQNVTVVMLPKK